MWIATGVRGLCPSLTDFIQHEDANHDRQWIVNIVLVTLSNIKIPGNTARGVWSSFSDPVDIKMPADTASGLWQRSSDSIQHEEICQPRPPVNFDHRLLTLCNTKISDNSYSHWIYLYMIFWFPVQHQGMSLLIHRVDYRTWPSCSDSNIKIPAILPIPEWIIRYEHRLYWLHHQGASRHNPWMIIIIVFWLQRHQDTKITSGWS